MKVKIGKYKNWYGPYQLAETLCFWAPNTYDEWGHSEKPEYVHKFGEWLAGGEKESLLYKFMLWIDGKRKRKINIRIDRWDTWNMDHTLAYIIVPMLEQLKATKQGAPSVDDEDVPVGLRSTSAPAKENEWDIDGNHFKRWDYVMNEMIFAFKLKITDDWEEECRSGVWDSKLEPCEWDEDGKPKYYKLVNGPNHTYEMDYDRYDRILKRQQNGFRLFGKYYSGLWD